MTGHEIREKFLQYFKDKGHEVVGSSSLLPRNDPTLLFTNAGMNQFKDLFLGNEKRAYSTAATCQKVVRAGGKHNDLENVGRTARHHTFFEMLGNFSFGDYFKDDAIKYGWDFLVNVLGLPAEKMFITIFDDDDEAFEIWNKKMGLPAEKIIRMGEKDNFWSMGDTGPCGPCSEIHIDQGEHMSCGPDCGPGTCDCDRHLELWNLVFMQFDRDKEGNLNPLPKPSIDTGMGLERITAVVQGVYSNYDTDLLQPIIQFTAKLAGVRYGDNDESDTSLRVIADHCRSTTFLVGDGVLPSNEGRGYVLRRIMRRAMRHGKMLGFTESFFYKVCEYVVNFMQGHYIELADKKNFISKVVACEEEQFSKTLTIGLKVIDELLEKYSENKVIPGEEMFRLYDTYGFPVDLLADIAEDNGYALDETGFNNEMKAQQERAKQAWKGSGEDSVSAIYRQLQNEFNAKFVGYDFLNSLGKVGIIIKDGAEVQSLNEGDEGEIFLDATAFYAEGGGQAGDSGVIKTDKALFRVENTVKFGDGLILHKGKMEIGSIEKGADVNGYVDEEARLATERNHTATHLLQKALQNVLGDHVRQAGSLVSPERLRFDFNHFAGVSEDEISRIEEEICRKIIADEPVSKSYKSIEEAVQGGAMALFGEKYGDVVRVVEVGEYSKELCGGCHVRRTGEIGTLKIISESSVASGVRRIEAVTGLKAVETLSKVDRAVKSVNEMLKTNVESIPAKVSELMEMLKDKDKEIRKLNEKLNAAKAGDLTEKVVEVNGIKVLAVKLDNADRDTMRNFVDTARDKLKSAVVLAGAVDGDKVAFVCGVTKDLVSKVKAGDVIKEVAAIAGGSGGGRPDMAQAGAKDPEKLDDAVAAVVSVVEKLSK